MKKLKKKINLTIEVTPTGYSAYVDDLSVYTTGENISTLYENIIEALNFYYEDLGYEVDASNLKAHLDLKQFFQHYKVLNAKFLAKKIGMNPTLLSQYVQGKKEPSTKQTNKIIKGVQEIGKELSNLNLV